KNSIMQRGQRLPTGKSDPVVSKRRCFRSFAGQSLQNWQCFCKTKYFLSPDTRGLVCPPRSLLPHGHFVRLKVTAPNRRPQLFKSDKANDCLVASNFRATQVWWP